MNNLNINEVIELAYFDLVDSAASKLSVGEFTQTESGDIWVMLKQGAIRIGTASNSAIASLTTAERLALTPLGPLEVYDTDVGYYYWWNVNESKWEAKATVTV